MYVSSPTLASLVFLIPVNSSPIQMLKTEILPQASFDPSTLSTKYQQVSSVLPSQDFGTINISSSLWSLLYHFLAQYAVALKSFTLKQVLISCCLEIDIK